MATAVALKREKIVHGIMFNIHNTNLLSQTPYIHTGYTVLNFSFKKEKQVAIA